jgi:uncharacterized protein (DUF488 family)
MLRRPADIPHVLAEYDKHIAANPTGLTSLTKLVRSKTVCLLCLEADHCRCHRDIIARRLRELTKWEPIHLR